MSTVAGAKTQSQGLGSASLPRDQEPRGGREAQTGSATSPHGSWAVLGTKLESRKE